MWTVAVRLLGPALAPLIIGAIALTAVAGIYGAGYRSAAGKCLAEQYKRERDAALHDLQNARDAARAAETLAEATGRYAEELQKKVDENEKAIPADKADCRRLSDDDAMRLRNIR